MHDKLYNFLLKLPKKNLVHLMSESLGLMQQYNGRTKTYCIAEALGCKQNSDGSWTMITLKKAKENTDDCPL